MESNGLNTIYLLGAGFSRSFDNEFPLSCDFIKKARDKKCGDTSYLKLNPSLELLDKFISDYFPEEPDLEEVMSFLAQDFFPPSFRQHWQHRSDIYDELLSLVSSFLSHVNNVDPHKEKIIDSFVEKITAEGTSIITFNYDCLIDHYLFKNKKWHPSSGYGVPFRHVRDCFHKSYFEIPSSTLSLIKLHGSINWGTLHCEKEESDPEVFYSPPIMNGIESNISLIGVTMPLSKDLFHSVGFRPRIVPPIIDKLQLYDNRFFRKLWYFARELLINTERIIIIGYSFPQTDYMARHLFKEALGSHLGKVRRKQIIVVNKDCTAEYEKKVKGIFANSDVDLKKEDAFTFIEEHLKEGIINRSSRKISLFPENYSPRMPFADNGKNE